MNDDMWSNIIQNQIKLLLNIDYCKFSGPVTLN